MTVHLVNLTNPMIMKGPYREVIPRRDQEVRLRLPQGARATKVQLLVAGREAEVAQDGGILTVPVPEIGIHEVIAVDL